MLALLVVQTALTINRRNHSGYKSILLRHIEDTCKVGFAATLLLSLFEAVGGSDKRT
jgi:hypothetical protein